MSNKQKVIMFFKGANCVPCKQFEPVFDSVVREFSGTTVIRFMNDVDMMARMGIRQVPTVVLADMTDFNKFEPYHIIQARGLREDFLRNAVTEFINDTEE